MSKEEFKIFDNQFKIIVLDNDIKKEYMISSRRDFIDTIRNYVKRVIPKDDNYIYELYQNDKCPDQFEAMRKHFIYEKENIYNTVKNQKEIEERINEIEEIKIGSLMCLENVHKIEKYFNPDYIEFILNDFNIGLKMAKVDVIFELEK